MTRITWWEVVFPCTSSFTKHKNGAPVESIRQSFPTLTLEQIHGALAFYLANQPEVEQSIHDNERLWNEFRASHPATADL